MDARRECLVGLTSMTEGFIDAEQLKQALSNWREWPDRSLAAILAERGWLSDAARSCVEGLVEAELSRQVDPRPNNIPSTVPVASCPDGTTTPRDMGQSAYEFHVNGEESSQEAPAIGPPTDATEEVADRYPRTQYHASGGMKIVYRVKDCKLGRDVALARLNPELAKNPMLVRRFVVEARITASLAHPNIVPIHDLYERSQPPSYTMPFLGGRTFSTVIREHHARKAGGPAPESSLRDLLESFLGVCNALAFAHGQGVIHRDLKGANVQIDTLGQTIVLDWGLAHRLSDPDDPLAREAEPGDTEDDHAHTYAPTRAGSAIGTIQYMPPEQARGDLGHIHKHSDVFGLGAMLYLILAGRPPYDSLKQAVAVEFRPPSAHKPGIPKPLEAICLKAMRAEPDDRYGSAESLAADVRRWLADEPVSVFPEPPSVRLSRWSRKHRPIVAGAAMLLTTAVVALGIGIWRVEIEKQNVVAEKDKAILAESAAANDARAALAYAVDVRNIFAGMLPAIPGTEAARADLADRTVRYVNAILNAHPDEPATHLETVRTLQEAAMTQRAVGRYEDAIATLERGVRVVQSLPKADPANLQQRDLLAHLLRDIGEARLLLGDISRADDQFRAAGELAESLVADIPGDPKFHVTHALALSSRSTTARLRGRGNQAIELGRAALREIDEVRSSLGPQGLSRLQMTEGMLNLVHEMTRGTLGEALGEAGQDDEAGLILGEEVKNLKALTRVSPDNQNRISLAEAIRSQARLLTREKTRRREALALLDGVIPEFAGLGRDFPGIPHYQLYLAEAMTDRASLINDILREGESPDAAQLRDKVRTDATEGIRLLEDLTRKRPKSPAYLGAIGRAVGEQGCLSGNRELLSRAIELEEQALKANPANPRDGEALKRYRAAIVAIQP